MQRICNVWISVPVDRNTAILSHTLVVVKACLPMSAFAIAKSSKLFWMYPARGYYFPWYVSTSVNTNSCLSLAERKPRTRPATYKVSTSWWKARVYGANFVFRLIFCKKVIQNESKTQPFNICSCCANAVVDIHVWWLQTMDFLFHRLHYQRNYEERGWFSISTPPTKSLWTV